ncbi:hypothetical protein HXY32_03375 [Candidatus Bathyarchaeota archaeon]|nr:hypothetical protein [Candidatus Bathyarchaeota archaeon]
MTVIRDLNQRAMRFCVIICGSADVSEYNPYNTFQPQVRKGIIIGFHGGSSVEYIAKSLNVSKEELLNHLKFLRDAEFVREKNGRMFPAFFAALKEDVLRTKKASKNLGEKLAKLYEARWETVIKTYRKLSVSSRFGFDRVGFVLIGAYSLDMIEKFAEEGKIMPKAPKRKAGSFYMWGVENGMKALGHYGMHSGQLGEYGFATFGGEKERRRTSPPDHWSKILMEEMGENNAITAYNKFIKLQSSQRETLKKRVDEETLKAFREYEKKYQDSNYKISQESEKHLKEWLYLDENLTPSAPIYTQKDIDTIKNFVDDMSTHIFDIIYKSLDRIQDTFRKCKASEYADFAEFFCGFTI